MKRPDADASWAVMQKNALSFRTILLSGLVLSGLGTLPVGSATRVWNGSYSGYWSAPQNWSGNVAPQAGDDLVFPDDAARLTNTNNIGAVFRSITFTGVFRDDGYVLRATPGVRLRLTDGIHANQEEGTCTVDMPVQLEASQTWTLSLLGGTGRILDVPGNVYLGAYDLTITTGFGEIRLGGVVSGAGGLILEQGTLRLYGTSANTYTGPTQVGGIGPRGALLLLEKSGYLFPAVAVPGDLIVEETGTVRLLKDYQIWSAYTHGAVTVNGGVLDFNEHEDGLGRLVLNGGTIRLGTNGLLNLASNVTVTADARIVGGRLDLGTMDRTIEVGSDATLTNETWVTGTGGMIKEGEGRLELLRASDFTGPMEVKRGVVEAIPSALGPGNRTTVNAGTRLVLKGEPGLYRVTDTLWLRGGGTNRPATLSLVRLLPPFPSPDVIGIFDLQLEGNLVLIGEVVIDTEYRTHLGVTSRIEGNGVLTKEGDGELALANHDETTYGGDVVVRHGVLTLAGQDGWSALPKGRLIIGDGVRGVPDPLYWWFTGEDLVRLAGPEQLGPIPIIIQSSGALDLDGHPQTLRNTIEMTGGEIRTGPGVLTLAAGAGVRVHYATNYATISGEVRLAAPEPVPVDVPTGALWLPARLTGPGGLRKTGSSTLELSGANSFSGPMRIEEGRVVIDNDQALGSVAGGTVVSQGAALQLGHVNIAGEPLTLEGGQGDFPYFGALLLWGVGPATWSGPITLQADATVGVVFDDTEIILSGPISGPGGLTKIGEGTLVYSGSTTNTYQGDTWVKEGTLQLSKPPFTGTIRHGTLIVGDGAGDAASARALWTEDYQLTERDMMGFPHATVPVVVHADGLADLNGHHERCRGLTLHAGRVRTGSEGSLKLDRDVTADSSATNVALIEGHLVLGVAEGLPVIPYTWTFDVVGADSHLDVRADIRGFWSGLRKTGPGWLSLWGSNTYDLDTIVSEGVLEITGSHALGTTNSGTRVEPGGTLALGALGIRVAGEPLVLAGDGFQGQGALKTSSWLGTRSNFWSGSITLSNDTRVAVAAGTVLNLAGAISGPGGLTKTGEGPLLFSGNEANTYAGVTRVEQGLLELKKSVPNGAIPSDLDISNGAIVRLLQSTQIGNAARVTVAANGVLDLNDAGEAFDELTGTGRVDLGSGYLNLGLDNGSSTFDGTISGAGNLTKYGAGTLTLRGNNPYTGTTTVREGMLVVDGAQSGSAVTVQTGATLRGNGWVGPLTVQGRVQPGDPGATSPGTLFCGNLSLSSSATLAATLFDAGSDRLQVQGGVQLGNATLALFRQTAPRLGQSFWLIDNDAADAINGTFAGLPEGGTVTVDGLPLRISYQAGTGNDVELMFAQAPVQVAGYSVAWGNGDGRLDPGDCDILTLIVTNTTGAAISGLQSLLQPALPGGEPVGALDGLWLTQPVSEYPLLPAHGTAANVTPFQLWLADWWECGRNVTLDLEVQAEGMGPFRLPVVLPTGSGGPARRFNSTAELNIPDKGTVESPLLVKGFDQPVAGVNVSLHLTHTAVGDLTLSLVAPDGTEVLLSDRRGGTLDDYGTSCADPDRTRFSDLAPMPIATGTPPFVGMFQPEQPLAAFIGLSGSAVNGTWKLRIRDNAFGGLGTLRCWALYLYPSVCPRGGGPCELCPADFATDAVLTTNAPVQLGQLRSSSRSTCQSRVFCPGINDTQPRHYHAYAFVNGEAAGCVTVQLKEAGLVGEQLFSAAYAGDFDPNQPCRNYLATAGQPGETSYSFSVGPRERFVVVVTQYQPGELNRPLRYRLEVSGGVCRPWLEATRAGEDKVRLGWTSAAVGYQLQRTDSLTAPGFAPLNVEPVVLNGQCVVTNTATAQAGFYRLSKP